MNLPPHKIVDVFSAGSLGRVWHVTTLCVLLFIGNLASSVMAQKAMNDQSLSVSQKSDMSNKLGAWENIPMAPVEDRMQAVQVALLPNGKVLIVNGSSNRDSMKRTEDTIYPGSNVSDYDAINYVSLFDPLTNTYQRLSAPRIPFVDGELKSGDMYGAGIVHLPDGRVLLVGGTKAYGSEGSFLGRQSAVVFDWQTNEWQSTTMMSDGRWSPTLLPLANGQIAAFSGIGGDTFDQNNGLIEFYDPTKDSWAKVDTKDIPGSPVVSGSDNKKGIDRIHHSPKIFPVSDGRLLMTHDGAGLGNMGSNQTYFITLDFDSESAIPSVSFTPAPSRKSTNKIYGSGILDPHTVFGDILLVGGQVGDTALLGLDNPNNAHAQVVKSLERFHFYKFGQGKWTHIKNYLGKKSYDQRIMHNMLYLPSRQILIVGGGNYAYQSPILEPALMTSNVKASGGYTIEKMARGGQPRLFNSNALLLPDGRVYVAGGNINRAIRKGRSDIVLNTQKSPQGKQRIVEKGQAYMPSEIWQDEYYSPPYLFIPEKRPEIVMAPKVINYMSAHQITVKNAGDVGRLTLIRLGASARGFDSSQRLAKMMISIRNKNTDGSHDISFVAPNNKHLYPPGYYMLFYVTAKGLPSVAAIVELQ